MRKSILILFSFIFFISTAHAAKKLSINIPLEETILNTGQKIWVSHNSETELVTISLIFKNTGQYFDPKDKAGLSRLFTQMLNEGVKDLNKEEIAKFKEEYGINLSVFNEDYQMIVNLTTPYENIEKAIYLLESYLTAPTFPADKLAKVKERMISNYRSLLHDVNYYTNSKAYPSFFANTPFANIPTEKTINNIRRKDLFNYLEGNFTSENILIGIAGNINDKLINFYLPKLIDRLPKNYHKNQIDPITLHSETNLIFENNTQFNTGIVKFYSRTLPINLNNYIKFKVLNEIFGGHRFNARLMESLRTKRGLVYGAYSDQIYNSFTHNIMSGTLFSLDKLEEGLSVIKKEIERLGHNGVTEEEVESAKNTIIASTAIEFETDQATAQMLANLQNYFSDLTGIMKINEMINDVSKYDLDQLCKEWFKLSNFYFYVLGDSNKIHNKSLIE